MNEKELRDNIEAAVDKWIGEGDKRHAMIMLAEDMDADFLFQGSMPVLVLQMASAAMFNEEVKKLFIKSLRFLKALHKYSADDMQLVLNILKEMEDGNQCESPEAL